ncbi:hypothetical protein EI613_32780 (plasmid) [Azospirillum sp. 412522]|nr:hypothetical protein [Azospirillum sp. 412522]MBY6266620.1 hypothetical protein [Azospirillum sp. 412522]
MRSIFEPEPIDLARACVIDVEASALGRGSYPIEVGVAWLDGRVMSWLIRPTAEWLERGVWEPAAEVAEGVMAALSGQLPHSDAVGADDAWLASLMAVTGHSYPRLEPLDDLLREVTTGSNKDRAAEVEQAMTEASARRPRRHRAGGDAARLAEMVRILADRADRL